MSPLLSLSSMINRSTASDMDKVSTGIVIQRITLAKSLMPYSLVVKKVVYRGISRNVTNLVETLANVNKPMFCKSFLYDDILVFKLFFPAFNRFKRDSNIRIPLIFYQIMHLSSQVLSDYCRYIGISGYISCTVIN